MSRATSPRVGFIGSGRHSSANLYPAFAATGARIAAVAERNPMRAEALAARGDVPLVVSGHRELLERAALDGAVISLAPELQPEVVADCLRAGVAVFVEKPLGANAAEARRIADLSAQTSVPVVLGFMKRYAPAYARVASLLGEQAPLGRPQSYVCTFGFAPWKPDLSEVEFVTQAVIHLIDLVRGLFGEAIDVTARRASADGSLSIVATIRHADGVIGSLNLVSNRAWSRETEELTVTAERGAVRCYDLSRVEVSEPAAPSERPWEDLLERVTVFGASNSPASGSQKDLLLRGYVGELRHFLDVLTGHAAPLTSAADNVKTMELCDRILEALDLERVP